MIFFLNTKKWEDKQFAERLDNLRFSSVLQSRPLLAASATATNINTVGAVSATLIFIPRKYIIVKTLNPPAVHSTMADQLQPAGIGPLAHLALVRRGVHAPLVVLEVLALFEGLAARVALVRLLPRVDSRMVLQVGGVQERLVAHATPNQQFFVFACKQRCGSGSVQIRIIL